MTSPSPDTSPPRQEYQWHSASAEEAHAYLLEPVAGSLVNAGAKNVLDLGCGNGALTAALAKRGFEIVGFDASKSGITLAQSTFKNASFAVYDVTQPLPAEHGERYDAVISVEVVEHLLLPRQLVRNAVFALKPGGTFVITTPYHSYWKNLALAVTGSFDKHWHPLTDFGHIKFFSRRTLEALLNEFGLVDIRSQRLGRIPPLAKSLLMSGIKPK